MNPSQSANYISRPAVLDKLETDRATAKVILNGSEGRSTRVRAVSQILLCDSQPVTAEGVRAVLAGSNDLRLAASCHTLSQIASVASIHDPEVILIDQSFGLRPIAAWLKARLSANEDAGERLARVVVWGNSISRPEAVSLMSMGVCTVLQKSAELESFFSCLRAAAQRAPWQGNGSLMQGVPRLRDLHLDGLTPREAEVLGFLQSCKTNREIARKMGIQVGTVKIHMKNIFAKTRVKSRYHLALSILQESRLSDLAL